MYVVLRQLLGGGEHCVTRPWRLRKRLNIIFTICLLEIPGQNTYSLARRMDLGSPWWPEWMVCKTSFRMFFGMRLSIISSMSFCLDNKRNITRRLEDMNFNSSWQKQYFSHSLCSFVKYCFATRK